jgi:hypothetical protein
MIIDKQALAEAIKTCSPGMAPTYRKILAKAEALDERSNLTTDSILQSIDDRDELTKELLHAILEDITK